MRAAVVIPARYASSRLPGKPLLNETGKTLIQHTYERARQAKKADAVIVATDDDRIFDAVRAFGGDVVMTDARHQSGTARVAEAASGLGADIIVNLQGDEPEINPAHIDLLIETHERAGAFASTLAAPFASDRTAGPGSPDDPSAVKAILAEKRLAPEIYEAAYFTRVLCPWPRDDAYLVAEPQRYFLHVGLYAFSKATLKRFAEAAPSPLECSAKLEQLRILEMGEKIAVALVSHAAPGIDTQADYDGFVAREKKRAL